MHATARLRTTYGVLAALVSLVGLAAACPALDPPFLPTYRGLEDPPVDTAEGRLLESDGCLWLEIDGTRLLVLWPEGSSLRQRPDGLVVLNDGHEAVVGSRVAASGFQYADEHYDYLTDLLGRQIPEPCRATGSYWLGHEVRTIGE